MLRCAKVKDEGASWGYKDASERSGPYTGYSCPLSYLDLVPEPTCPPGCPACAEDRCGNAWARQWRERVRAYHAERVNKRAVWRAARKAKAQVVQAKAVALAFLAASGGDSGQLRPFAANSNGLV
jgi:hypothetical protein